MTNARISETFLRVAELLEEQGASPHRVRAWREGAQAVRAHPRELADVFRDHGRVGLEAVPHIGPRLAVTIIELVKTGDCAALHRLAGDAIHTLERLPGMGPRLAERVHRTLGIETLEELEVAAHDGRLARVEGFGARRIAAVRDLLAARFARRRPEVPAVAAADRPPVGLLLEVDRRYRDAATAGTLPTIAPRRFNPGREAWLPILHLERDGWSFTAMFSNTELAHRLDRTRDWVIVTYHQPHGPEGQATVVTERRGASRGLRMVRGREQECEELRWSAAA